MFRLAHIHSRTQKVRILADLSGSWLTLSFVEWIFHVLYPCPRRPFEMRPRPSPRFGRASLFGSGRSSAIAASIGG